MNDFDISKIYNQFIEYINYCHYPNKKNKYIAHNYSKLNGFDYFAKIIHKFSYYDIIYLYIIEFKPKITHLLLQYYQENNISLSIEILKHLKYLEKYEQLKCLVNYDICDCLCLAKILNNINENNLAKQLFEKYYNINILVWYSESIDSNSIDSDQIIITPATTFMEAVKNNTNYDLIKKCLDYDYNLIKSNSKKYWLTVKFNRYSPLKYLIQYGTLDMLLYCVSYKYIIRYEDLMQKIKIKQNDSSLADLTHNILEYDEEFQYLTETLLYTAIYFKKYDIAEYLYNNGCIVEDDSLYKLAKRGENNFFKKIFNRVFLFDSYVIYAIINYNNIELLEFVYDKININTSFEDNFLLHAIKHNKYLTIPFLVKKYNINDKIKDFDDYYDEYDFDYNNYCSILHIVVCNNNCEMLKYLLN